MKKYIMKKINEKKKTYFIVLLTYDSVLDYVNDIEKSISYDKEYVIIVDQLLSTGNNKNRFIICEAQNGKLLLFTARNIEGSMSIRELSSQILKGQKTTIENSILTNKQKDKIMQGKPI